MKAVLTALEQSIKRWHQKESIADHIAASEGIDGVDRLAGDASTRQYFRIYSGKKSLILMKRETFVDQEQNLPFLAMQSLLDSHQVRVPKVFSTHPGRGLIVLEDLGDRTFLKELAGVKASTDLIQWYRRAIDLLIQIHSIQDPVSGAKSLEAFQHRFDEKKLMWEVDFTIQHFVRGYLSIKDEDAIIEAIRKEYQKLCQYLASQPVVLTHRDYHSRNLMISGDELVAIDFQDARLGPVQYDLVSLLKDCYFELSQDQVSELIQYYIDQAQERLDSQHLGEDFFEIFDSMAVQRSFKAIGSFAYIYNEKKDPSYLRYIGLAFSNIHKIICDNRQFEALREGLFYLYYR